MREEKDKENLIDSREPQRLKIDKKIYFQSLNGINLSDILYTYVLCNVDKFKILNLKNNDFKLCIELPVKVKKNNHTYVDLEMFERKRFDGKKKVNVIKDGLLISYEIFKSFFYIYFK